MRLKTVINEEFEIRESEDIVMKNKGLKKMVAFGMMMTMLFSTGLVANAAKTSWKTSHKFNSKWELTKTWVTDSVDPGFVLSCAYGFDTFLVNEDYVTSCKSTLLSHEAAVLD